MAAAMALLALLLGAGSASAAETMALQPDGRIVLGGPTAGWSGALVRLRPDGSIDPSFAGDGVSVIPGLAVPGAVALQPDGKILSASVRSLMRYLPDGRVDQGFGSSGQGRYGRSPASVSKILTLPDGRIAVGGDSPFIKYAPNEGAFGLLFSVDGRSVETLGTPGPGSTLAGMALQQSGAVVMTGARYGQRDLASGFLTRFQVGAGTPYDTAFGGGVGLAPVFPGASSPDTAPKGIVATPGALLVVGRSGGQFALARFSGDGIRDSSFSGDGVAGIDVEPGKISTARAAVVLPDGKILVVGDASSAAGGDPQAWRCGDCWHPLVARFLPNGELDPAFGEGGVARLIDAQGAPVSASGEDLALLPDGRMLAAGSTTDGWNGRVVTRLLSNGTVDSSFGDGGVATIYPCDDGHAAQGFSGCVRAGAKVRVHHLATGQPSLQLQVRSRAPWMVIRAVQLRLPRPLQFRARPAERLRAVFVDSQGRQQLRKPKVGRVRVTSGPHRWDVEAMGLDVPAGTLARLRSVAPHRKLPFRITVWFAAKQHIPLKQRFVLRRSG